MRHFARTVLSAAAAAACLVTPVAAQDITLRALGIVSTHRHHTALERSFYEGLAATTGVPVTVNFNPLDVLGVNMQDTMRLVRSGTFDIVETTIGAASRDDPFLEGLDLIGVSPDIETLQEVVDAYREVFTARVAERFNAHVLTLWPFGPQVFFCRGDVNGVADLRGLRVRSFTPTMSALVQHLGATPVTLQFAEVYPALQRGVAECAITSPTSGNTGNWPEVTDTLFMLGISWSVQTHLINLDTWNRMSPEAQAAMTEAFNDLEAQYWDMARELTGNAVACSTGQPCEGYNAFTSRLVEPTAEDIAAINDAVEAVVLSTWAETCNANYPGCTDVWNSTVGAVRGLTIR